MPTLTVKTAPNGANNCHSRLSSVSGPKLYTKRQYPGSAPAAAVAAGAPASAANCGVAKAARSEYPLVIISIQRGAAGKGIAG